MDSQSLLALADRIQLLNAQAIRQKVEGPGDSASLPLNLFGLGRDAPIANNQKQAAGDNRRDEMKTWHHQGPSGLNGMSGAEDLVRSLGELGPSGSQSDGKAFRGGRELNLQGQAIGGTS